MDEEDLADAEETRKLQTSQAFAGLGLTQDDTTRSTGLAGLFRVEGETMGTRLLRKMGWKDGQGVGPKVRRTARLEVGNAKDRKTTYLFAPDNVIMVSFVKKTDRKGLGYKGEAKLAPIGSSAQTVIGQQSDDDEEEDDDMSKPAASLGFVPRRKKEAKGRGGIGIGVLNDTGSDDEDPYEMGPKISYNRVIGGQHKKKKKTKKERDRGDLASAAANPLLKSKPVFLSKKSLLGKIDAAIRRCHDGRLPLDGFVFGQGVDSLISEITSEGKYPPPKIPDGWTSSKQQPAQGTNPAAAYVSTADAAKSSNLDPKSRAAVLGEQQLPGKSVFDFLSPAARERVAAATGRTDLPEARGEIPAAYALSAEEKRQELLKDIPKLDKETALAAISRGASGGAPYADDEAKRSRYRTYLEHEAGRGSSLPTKPAGMSNDDWLREFHEFFNCARIFKPMSGFMASRFTTSSTKAASTDRADDKDLVTRPALKPLDPAEEAAKMGMYGSMTRSVQDFFPTRLLCKRMNVKPPAHVMPDHEASTGPSQPTSAPSMPQSDYGMGDRRLDFKAIEAGPGQPESAAEKLRSETRQAPRPVVDATRNDALEGKRPGEEVFKAIFGDSSDDEDDDDDD